MLTSLKPNCLAVRHGSSFRGNGELALRELAAKYAATLGEPAPGTGRSCGKEVAPRTIAPEKRQG